MIAKPLLAPVAALLLATPYALLADLYETGFEEFAPGEIQGQHQWSANYGTESELCTIVTTDTAPLPAPEGVQMLQLVRPSVERVPGTGLIFHQSAQPLTDFTVEFFMAYEAKTNFPLFQFQIGSAADSESGVQVGIGFFEETKASRTLHVYTGRGSQRKPVPAPEGKPSLPIDPLAFYHFTLRIHDGGGAFDLTVRQEETIVALMENQPIPHPAKNYNRLIISQPGGSRGDQLFFDGLKIRY